MKKRVQAMLDSDTVKELERIAASKHITVSAVVRQILENHISFTIDKTILSNPFITTIRWPSEIEKNK